VALRDTAPIDLRPARIAAGGMLAVAAVRPLVPVETTPPCPLRLATGIPCPLCGMTRGVTAVVHGSVGKAFELNPASVALVLLAVVLLVTPRLPRRVRVPLWVLVAVLGAMWAFQLAKYATGQPL
jgi:hypothetical protein